MIMYLPHQERLDNEILNAVLDERERADFERYSANDVKTALKKNFLDLEDFKALLSPAAAPLLGRKGGKRAVFWQKYLSFYHALYLKSLRKSLSLLRI